MGGLAIAGEIRTAKRGVICQVQPRPGAPPSFTNIDIRRREHKISISRLIAEAGVHRDTWTRVKRHGVQLRPQTRAKLNAALDRLIRYSSPARPPALIAAFVRSAELLLAIKISERPELINACAVKRDRRTPAQAVNPARLQRLAIYVTAVELEVENADIARAIGCTRQNIKQARDDIEELREDPIVERFLDQFAGILKERAQ